MAKPPKSFTPEQQAAVGRRLQRIARLIDRELAAAGAAGMPWSFYTWGGNRSQYVSNAQRADVKAVMQETLARWDDPDTQPYNRGS